jgi:prepilin-type N-terminal cleavage/methylation domain-containing protein
VRRRRIRSCRAFTLIEVLVAIALVLALVGTMFGFLYDMLSSRRRALTFADNHSAAATLLERLEADLMCGLVGDRVSGAGIEGDEARLSVLTRGVAASLAERGAADPTVFGDLQVAEYRFRQERKRLEARRQPAGDRNAEGTAFSSLGGELYKVRFRYHDGAAWRESFDSLDAGRLPAAVEVAVWFDAPYAEQMMSQGVPGRTEPARSGRLTFDDTGGFDERAYAELSDLDLEAELPPDRIRVIVIPDAGGEEEGERGFAAEEGT